jgi:hypothetical protein
MTEDIEAARYVAQQQSIMDALTRKIYGPRARFERLSAFGQNTIETMARNSKMLDNSEHPSFGIHSPVRTIEGLRQKLGETQQQLEESLRHNQELWQENEDLRLELMDLEDEK